MNPPILTTDSERGYASVPRTMVLAEVPPDLERLLLAAKAAAGYLQSQGSPAAQRLGDELRRAMGGMA